MPFGGQRRLGQRLARAGHRGARRLLGLEDGLRQPRPRRGLACRRAVALDPGARGLAARPGQERPRARRPSADRLLDRGGARERRLRRGRRLDRLARRSPRSRAATAPRCPACGRPSSRRPTSPDIEWVEHALDVLGRRPESSCFSILRPTSPFRGAEHDPPRLRAARSRSATAPTRSARSSSCRQHPGKMWVLEGELMRPLLDAARRGDAAALAPVPGAARGLRPELEPRDRLDARARRATRTIAGRARRAVPHRGRRGLLDRLPGRLGARRAHGRRGEAALPGAADPQPAQRAAVTPRATSRSPSSTRIRALDADPRRARAPPSPTPAGSTRST